MTRNRRTMAITATASSPSSSGGSVASMVIEPLSVRVGGGRRGAGEHHDPDQHADDDEGEHRRDDVRTAPGTLAGLTKGHEPDGAERFHGPTASRNTSE